MVGIDDSFPSAYNSDDGSEHPGAASNFEDKTDKGVYKGNTNTLMSTIIYPRISNTSSVRKRDYYSK